MTLCLLFIDMNLIIYNFSSRLFDVLMLNDYFYEWSSINNFLSIHFVICALTRHVNVWDISPNYWLWLSAK